MLEHMFAMSLAASQPPPTPRRLALVREAPAGYDVGPNHRTDRITELARAVDAVLAVGIDSMADVQVQDELVGLQRQVRRLEARGGELAAAIAARQAARARAARPNDQRASQRAEREARREVAKRLRATPGAVKKAVEAARGLADLPAARRAARDGTLSSDHAAVIADTTRHFAGPERGEVEAELVEAAARCNPVELRAVADRLLAERDHDAAMRDADRRRGRRFFRAAKTKDGDVRLSGLLAGLDAETFLTALDAFRTFDVPGTPPRRPEVRSADALAAMARAALDHGTNATAHGARPHVTVVVDWKDLIGGTGTGSGEARWTGPVPTGDLRRLLDDSVISRVVVGPDSMPIDTGRATRTVGAGVWKALVARDGHCTFPGCDAPPSWCQAAHLGRRWIEGAGVSVAELALACHYHHRLLDRQKWRGSVRDGRVVWDQPKRPPSGVGATAGRAPP